MTDPAWRYLSGAQRALALKLIQGEPMNTNKDHFVAVLTEAEASGLLPKGKTADILENYDFLIDAIDKRTKLIADVEPLDRPTIPDGDPSTGDTFVKGRGKNKNPPPDAA